MTRTTTTTASSQCSTLRAFTIGVAIGALLGMALASLAIWAMPGF